MEIKDHSSINRQIDFIDIPLMPVKIIKLRKHS